MTKRTLIFLLGLAACEPEAPKAPPVSSFDLRWKLQPNQTLWIRTEMTSEQGGVAEGNVPPNMIPPRSSYTTSSLTEVLVLDEGPAGEFGLRLTPLEFTLSGSIDGAPVTLEYRDGAWTKESVGQTTTGSTINLKEKIQEFKDAASRSATRRYGSLSTRDPSTKGGMPPVPLSWPALPPGTVTVGATWTEPLGLGPTFVSLKGEPLTATTKLSSVQGDAASIDSALSNTSTAKGVTQECQRQRHAEFDVKRGLFLTMQEAGKLINQGSLPEGATYKVWYTMTIRLNLLDKR